MKTTTRTLTAAVALLAAAGALAACTAAGPVQTPGVTDPGTPTTPVETQEPVVEAPVELVPGATVTDEQASAINRDSDDGARAYKLADGTNVVVMKDQPVPDVVAADGGAKSSAAAQADAERGKDYHAGVDGYAKQYAVETGKRVVHVKYMYAADFTTGGYGWIWAIDTIDDLGACGDRETCVAEANAWIAGQPDAARWTVLVSA